MLTGVVDRPADIGWSGANGIARFGSVLCTERCGGDAGINVGLDI